MNRLLLVAVLLVAATCTMALADVFVVTNTSDTGTGSLERAIFEANLTNDMDTVYFDIPGPGPHVINDAAFFPNRPVLIDGYSQPGAVPNTNAGDQPFNGTIMIEVSGAGFPSVDVFTVASTTGSEIRGLSITNTDGRGVWFVGNGNHTLSGCFVGLDPAGIAAGNRTGVEAWSDDNSIGGTAASMRNVIADNDLWQVRMQGDRNLIRGNIISMAPDGVREPFNEAFGPGTAVEIVGNDNILGGAIGGARNAIRMTGSGIRINGNTNIVRRNRIGLDVTGTVDVSGGGRLYVISGSGNIVGGRVNGGKNQIAAIIEVGSSATGTIIRRNSIGVGVGGVAIGGSGVYIAGNNTRVGGVQVNDGNTIAHNGIGVRVIGSATGVTIRRNSIFDNGGTSGDELGIDLGNDGVTANDSTDADSGPNGLQNYPVITDIVISGGFYDISGYLSSTPNATFNIELFGNSERPSSGYGEGELYLTTFSVTTNSNGFTTFSVTVPNTVPVDDYITATATASNGSTSEFGVSSRIAFMTILNANDSGYGSLRRAIEDANATANTGNDHITRDKSLQGVVFLQTPLPAITDKVAFPSVPGAGNPDLVISGALLLPGSVGMRVEADLTAINDVEFIDFTTGTAVLFLADGHVGNCLFDNNATAVHIQADGVNVDGCDFLNNSLGVWVLANDATVYGCYFGNGFSGPVNGNVQSVVVEGDNNTIGGPAGWQRNRFFGTATHAIWLKTTADNNVIEGNFLGDTNRPDRGSGFHGIWIEGSLNSVGSEDEGDQNVIAYSGWDGISVTSGIGNKIGINPISESGNLGIDLGNDGVTLNDGGDGDAGPNNLVNYPVIDIAFSDGCDLYVAGSYSGKPNTNVTVHVYTSDTCNPTGFGEGASYIGSFSFRTDFLGVGTFSDCYYGVTAANYTTATATTSGGTSEFSPCLQNNVSTAIDDGVPTPTAFELYQNAPNPFNPTTTIAYDVARDNTHVSLIVYDVQGRVVATLVDEPQRAGQLSVTWGGRDDSGNRVASGMYFYRLVAGEYTATRKMLMLK